MAAGIAALLAGAGGLALVLSRRTPSGGGAAIATENRQPTQIQGRSVAHEDAPPAPVRVQPELLHPELIPLVGDISADLGAMELRE